MGVASHAWPAPGAAGFRLARSNIPPGPRGHPYQERAIAMPSWPPTSSSSTGEGRYTGLIRDALAAGPPPAAGRWPGLRPAAVLVPILCGSEGERLVLTRRTDRVEYHKGQISFPGGAVDPADRDRIETALRESREEIGLQARDVEVLGVLDEVPVTRSAFCITPVVGAIRRSPYPWVVNPVEVAEVLEVPLAWLLRPAFPRIRTLDDGHGRAVEDYVFEWGEHLIWGATGRIVKSLLDRIRASMGSG